MTTYARKINNAAIDVVTEDPATLFHADIAAEFMTVPDGTINGATYAGCEWINPPAPVTAPEPAPTPEASYPKVSPVEFKLLFTSPERVAIKAARATDPVVDDFFEIVEDPRLTFVNIGLESTQQALLYLESVNLITEERRLKILTGELR